MFEEIGHPVMRLRRVAIGPVFLGDLPSGSSRKMTSKEIRLLMTQMSRPPKETKDRAKKGR
jgi:16S rRNA U516 pseudouridylate synthase RsuA-like enzyme